MAQPTVTSFGKGLLYVEDPATPGTFNKICGFNKIDLKLDKNFDTTVVPDCDDPDAAAWNGVEVSGLGWSGSCDGLFTKEGWEQLWAVAQSGVAVGFRLRILDYGDAGTPDLQFSGSAHYTLGLSGQRGQKWQNTVSFTGDGPLAGAAVAALV